MPELILFAINAIPNGQDIPQKHVVVWDRSDVPSGWYSLPQEVNARLPSLRAELMAWVYDLGRVSVRGQEVQAHLQCGDALSLWWCSLLFEKHPKVTSELYPALKLRALEYVLVEGNYTSLCLHGGDARLRTTLEQFCKTTGRAWRWVPASSCVHTQQDNSLKARLRRVYYALPGPCKAVGRFVYWLWQIKRLLPCVKEPCPPGDAATIATYFPNIDNKAAAEGRFYSRYWESLHTALASSSAPRIHWLFIHFPSPQYTWQQCVALRRAFAHKGQNSYYFLEEFLNISSIARACTRYIRIAWHSWRMEAFIHPHFHFADSRMALWAYLGQYWRDSFQGWRALERCLQREAMCAWTIWAGQQRWTIFPLENCPWERMLTHAVHTAGHGPVYGAQHSVVRSTDFRFFDDARTFVEADCILFQPDMLYGNGQGAVDALRGAGVPAARLDSVEALRYMYLVGRHGALRSASGQYTSGAHRLLVVTSFFADEVEEHIRVLAAWLAEYPDAAQWEIIIKPHPYLAVMPYLEKYFPPGAVPLVVEESLDALLQVNTVVWASNSTTVALEAAFLGLPVLVQLPVDDIDLCPVQNIPGVARVATAAQVPRALQEQEVPQLAADYLALDTALPRWRRLLGLGT